MKRTSRQNTKTKYHGVFVISGENDGGQEGKPPSWQA